MRIFGGEGSSVLCSPDPARPACRASRRRDGRHAGRARLHRPGHRGARARFRDPRQILRLGCGGDRESGGEGKRGELGGRRIIKKKKTKYESKTWNTYEKT